MTDRMTNQNIRSFETERLDTVAWNGKLSTNELMSRYTEKWIKI